MLKFDEIQTEVEVKSGEFWVELVGKYDINEEAFENP